jgi:ketosteroid isomerase-like protein
MSKAQQILETWFHRVWTEEDAAVIDELFIPDGKARGLGANTLIGPDGYKQFHSALLNLITDCVITLDKTVEEGDWLAAVCTLRAKDRKSGAPVIMTGTTVVKFAGGKIIEAYNNWDFMGMFSQLGFLPSATFEMALSGAKIA